MRKHPELGAALIGRVTFLEKARALVLRHHERFDGRGYPGGFAGSEFPFAARIFAVADTLRCAQTSRPYRPGCSYSEAREVIAHGQGSQFAPEIVAAFLSISFEKWAEIANAHGVEMSMSRTAAKAALG